MANNLAAFQAEAFSKLLIKNLDQINVMMPLVSRDYEGEIAGVGATVHVRTLGSVTTGTWSPNGTISYQELAPATEPLTVDTSDYFAFKVDDVDAATNDLDALRLYARRAAVAVNNLIETFLQGIYTSSSIPTANKITGAASAAITLTSHSSETTDAYNVIVSARTALAKQNAPVNGRWLIVDPDTTALLLADTSRFIRATNLGDQVVEGGMLAMARPGFIGRCAGFDIYESNAVPVASSAKYLLYGVEGMINYAALIKSVEAMRLETTFASAVRGLLLHGKALFAESGKAVGYIKASA